MSKPNRGPDGPIERLFEAIDAVPDEVEGEAAVRRLGIDVRAWAAEVRNRVGASQTDQRRQAFAKARARYEAELDTLATRRRCVQRTTEAQQATLRALVARAPAALHFHKFDGATTEEVEEIIRALQHLLGDKDG